MAHTSKNPEVEALQLVHDALRPLRPEARQRVLAAVQVLFGMQQAAATQQQQMAPQKPTASRSEPEERPHVPSKDRPTSIGELVAEKKPRTNAQYITLFAYHRDRFQGAPRFSRDDLKDFFPMVHVKPPENYSRDFIETVKRGWVHEDGMNSYITSKGIEAVESGFEGSPRPGPRPPGQAPRKRTRNK
jgi:hypothetical protein